MLMFYGPMIGGCVEEIQLCIEGKAPSRLWTQHNCSEYFLLVNLELHAAAGTPAGFCCRRSRGEMSGRDPPAALGGSARAAGGDKTVCSRYIGKVSANVSPEERRHQQARRKIPLLTFITTRGAIIQREKPEQTRSWREDDFCEGEVSECGAEGSIHHIYNLPRAHEQTETERADPRITVCHPQQQLQNWGVQTFTNSFNRPNQRITEENYISTKKRKGPKMEPWGSPWKIGTRAPRLLLLLSECFVSVHTKVILLIRGWEWVFKFHNFKLTILEFS